MLPLRIENLIVTKLTMIQVSLLTALVGATACDSEVQEDEYDLVEDAEFRCAGIGCSGGPLGNGPQIGLLPVGVFPKDFNELVTNHDSDMTFLWGKIVHAGQWRIVTNWFVDQDGMLHLIYEHSGMEVELSGTDVIDLVWRVKLTDANGTSQTKIRIVDAVCSPGDPCLYTLMTPTPSGNLERPMTTLYGPPMWSLCTSDTNGGTLGAQESTAVVFAKNTHHDYLPALNDIAIDANNTVDSIFCVNDAAGKVSYRLGANYDSVYDPSPTALAGDEQSDAVIKAIRAYAGGAPQTTPGTPIFIEDLTAGVFDASNRPVVAELEGVYDGTQGLYCRGSNAAHRYVDDPMLDIPGYDALPVCPTDLSELPNSASIAVWTDL